jgi:hypothetical protein
MMTRPAYDPKTEELEYVAGDKDPYSDDPEVAAMYRSGKMVDPTGMTDNVGQASQIDMTPGKKKIDVRYEGKHGNFVVTIDVYAPPGGAGIELHAHCPKCRNVGRITSERKAIEFENGVLSVEPWMCTWEGGEGRRMEFGLGLCRARYAIDRNVMKDV